MNTLIIQKSRQVWAGLGLAAVYLTTHTYIDPSLSYPSRLLGAIIVAIGFAYLGVMTATITLAVILLDAVVKGGIEAWGQMGTVLTLYLLAAKIRHEVQVSQAEGEVLRAKVKVREDFLSMASHELRTPLSSMKLATYLLKKKKDPSPEFIAKQAETLDRQVGVLATLVDDLLVVSRVRAGRLRFNPSEFDLRKLVADVLDELKGEIIKSGSPVIFNRVQPVMGYWDRDRLRQVVCNLVTNALKYGRGHPVQIKLKASPTQVVVIIEDKGEGIPQGDIDRLFERFERAHEGHITGAGLGLWIVRTLTEAMGGTIAVESTPGLGSKFTVTLPRRDLQKSKEDATLRNIVAI